MGTPSRPRLVRISVTGWCSLAAAVWVPLLAAFAVTAFYRMMGCGTGRTPSVGICSRAHIDLVLNLTRAAILLILVVGLVVSAVCCVLLLVGDRGTSLSRTLRVSTWFLTCVWVLVVATMAVQTPWHAVGIMGLPIFFYGTAPASIFVALSLLLLIPVLALARRPSSARK